MRFFKSTILAVAAGAGVAMAQTIDPSTLPSCATTCLNNMQDKFGDFGCASREDYTCLCKAPDWRAGIASCSSEACQGADAPASGTLVTYADEKCAAVLAGTTTQAPAETSLAQTTEPPAESSAAAETTTTPEPEATTTDAVASDQGTTTSTPTTLATSIRPTSSATDSGASGTNTADADSAAASGTTSEDTDGDSSRLTVGAKIGIAVGAGAAGVIVFALLLALFCRRRDRKKVLNEKNLQISSPMPGSGRSYASTESSPKAAAAVPFTAKSKGISGRNDLELTSTRYENMVPRTQPSLTQVGN